jgi:hypothetical protein
MGLGSPFEQIRRYLICSLLSNATSSQTCHAEIARLTKAFDNLPFSHLLLKACRQPQHVSF